MKVLAEFLKLSDELKVELKSLRETPKFNTCRSGRLRWPKTAQRTDSNDSLHVSAGADMAEVMDAAFVHAPPAHLPYSYRGLWVSDCPRLLSSSHVVTLLKHRDTSFLTLRATTLRASKTRAFYSKAAHLYAPTVSSRWAKTPRREKYDYTLRASLLPRFQVSGHGPEFFWLRKV